MLKTFFFLFFPFWLAAASADLSFAQLIADLESYPQKENQHVGQSVRVRGFLYNAENHLPILSAEPNLKSCCVARGPKAMGQIRIESLSPLPVSTRAVSIEGTLALAPLYNDKGSLTNLYVLKNATVIEPEGNYWPMAIMVGVISGLAVVLWRLNAKKPEGN